MPRAIFTTQFLRPRVDILKIHMPLSRSLKRLTDIGGAIAGLLLFSPAFLILFLLIPRDGGPALYGHTRIGKNGKAFKCWKFRSMHPTAARDLQTLLDHDPEARKAWEGARKFESDPRITKLGAFIRKTSLDEIPQFYNILKGDMSLVGPRPVTRTEIHRYGPYAKDYTSVKPGLTGLWQVSGRNDLSYDHRTHLDSRYVRQWTWRMDVGILLKTVFVVFTRRGAY